MTGRGYACAWCGATVTDLPLTWTTSVENGQTRYYCAPCSRDNVRAIEGRLDAPWW